MIFKFADCELDTTLHELRRGGAISAIEPQVFDLLQYLIKNQDRLVTRSELFDAVWTGRTVSEWALSNCIMSARKAVGDSGKAQALIRTIPRRGFRFVGKLERSQPPREQARTAVDVPFVQFDNLSPDKPSIAVLPFDNMSDQQEHAYFADGIAEDITTELSRFGSLFVVSRHSAFKYRGDGMDLAQVGEALGVQFLLEGSVRRSGGRVRINAQLIDVRSANHVWAERYDQNLADIFAIQDEITETVASTVAGRVQVIGTVRARRKSTANLEAYDYLLRGLDLYKGGVVEMALIERAVAMFDKAIELDAGFARAYAWRACSGSRVWGPDFTDENLEETIRTIKTALSLDEDESESHRIMGAAYMFKRDFERAEIHIQRAVDLNPNDANVAVKSGTYYSYSGQPEAALASIHRAMRLNPYHPEWYWTELGLAHHTAGDYALAIEALLHNTTPSFLDLALLAASYFEVGRLPEASLSATKLSENKPNAKLVYFRDRLPYRRQEDLSRLVTGLQKAGVPEA